MRRLRLLLSALIAHKTVHVEADAPSLGPADYEAYNAGHYGMLPNQTFRSSNLTAPRFLVSRWDRQANAANGLGTHIFMSPVLPGQALSPVILNASDLSLVYADPAAWQGGSDAKVQHFEGAPYLTFCAGRDLTGFGDGFCLMVDSSYRLFRNFTTAPALPTGADNHEFQLTPDGTGALLLNFHSAAADLTGVGGLRDDRVFDCAFQELDVATGAVRFTWRASERFSFDESYYPYDPNDTRRAIYGWDWFHLNSVQKIPRGDYLVSSRHLRMVALVSGADGSRLWQIGGRRNGFTDLSAGRATDFGYQHEARLHYHADADHTDNADRGSRRRHLVELTMFDNRVRKMEQPTPGCARDCSRGLRLALDLDRMTAAVVREYPHPRGVQARAQGGFQALSGGGRALVAWGTVPSFTEFADDATYHDDDDSQGGQQPVMEVQSGPWYTSDLSTGSLYRVSRANWTAHPTWPPAVAVAAGAIYLSWNGATEVAFWAVLGGDSVTALALLAIVARAGFETSVPLPVRPPPRLVAALPLDASRRVLSSTALVDAVTGREAASPAELLFSRGGADGWQALLSPLIGEEEEEEKEL